MKWYVHGGCDGYDRGGFHRGHHDGGDGCHVRAHFHHGHDDGNDRSKAYRCVLCDVHGVRGSPSLKCPFILVFGYWKPYS